MGNTCCTGNEQGTPIEEMKEMEPIQEAKAMDAEPAKNEEPGKPEVAPEPEPEVEEPKVAEAAKEEAERPEPAGASELQPCEFTVILKKPDPAGKWGFTLSNTKAQLAFLRDKDGIIEDWNKHNPTKAIRMGDEVIKVNGVSGIPATLMEALKSETAEIVFKRQLKLTVETKGEGPLGLELSDDTCEVKAISAGEVETYNKTAHVCLQIQPGDLLAEINGAKTSKEDASKLEEGKAHVLVFQRPGVE